MSVITNALNKLFQLLKINGSKGGFLIKLSNELEYKAASLDFEEIYKTNGFLGSESLSGEGASLHQTRIIRDQIPKLLRDLGINSMLDVPCGDWHWMRDVNLGDVTYIGGDIVQAIVDINNKQFGGLNISFRHINIIADTLPLVDLILCRDCLVHLSFEDGLLALDNFKKSGATWLLTTTFVDRNVNTNLFDGEIWRPLNLEIGPYNLGKADFYINEGCTEEGGQFTDKCLALWRLK